MWSSRPPTLGRRGCLALGAALLLPAGLGACGFRPLYGGPRGDAAAAELAAIEVAAPLSRVGRILENQLISDLNPSGLAVAKRYRLDVRLERNKKALAIQLDDTITRFDLTLSAFFTLRPDDGRRRRPAPVPDAARSADGGIGDNPAAAATVGVPEAAPGEPEPEDAAPPLYRSAVRRVASYNVIREPFATLIAEQDAERRAAVELSREIRTLLTIFFETNTA
jgi:LPS-assembly lipoprotein